MQTTTRTVARLTINSSHRRRLSSNSNTVSTEAAAAAVVASETEIEIETETGIETTESRTERRVRATGSARSAAAAISAVAMPASRVVRRAITLSVRAVRWVRLDTAAGMIRTLHRQVAAAAEVEVATTVFGRAIGSARSAA